jgi:serine protease Do
VNSGDSDKLKIGQLVIAIGKPFGFQLVGPTVTVEIVSALNQRLVGGEESPVGWIQTDAAINPGNSGGPLVDEFGSIIGINTAGLGADWDIGINFAIPINVAKTMAEGFITRRETALPWTGIFGLDITRETSTYYNLPHGGVLVTRVAANGSADKAGITAGDVIIEIDGRPLETMDRLLKEANGRRVGDSVELTVKRGGTTRRVEILLEEKP